jgi:hypothetical protein
MNSRQAAFIRTGFLLLAILAASFSTKLLAINSDREISHGHKTFEDDKKTAKKEKSVKNTIAVKVYPDAIKKSMHVIARGTNEKEISFFVFDVEGKMIVDYTMKAGQRKTISSLRRGSYMYHVFCGDEYIGSGRIQFR